MNYQKIRKKLLPKIDFLKRIRPKFYQKTKFKIHTNSKLAIVIFLLNTKFYLHFFKSLKLYFYKKELTSNKSVKQYILITLFLSKEWNSIKKRGLQ